MSRWRGYSLIFLTASAFFLYGFPSASIPYVTLILLHTGIGILFAVLLFPFLLRRFRSETLLAKSGWVLLSFGTALGLALIKLGTPHALKSWLFAHILMSVLGVMFVATDWINARAWLGTGVSRSILRFTLVFVVIAAAAAGAWWSRNIAWRDAYVVHNPKMPPANMDGEGDGPHGKFFPSSAQTKDGNYIPSQYFMQSKACERCHADIYKQWESSAHHFSSFNNQWYRKSIEYMQGVTGVQSSKWCAGCHDPALLFSGKFDTPIRQIENTPEAKAGLSCLMCHSIVQVKSTMGQGDFVLEYPKLHELAASENPVIRSVHDFLVRLNPEPHRRTFLKPFMRTQTAEFCSSCHKIHLDIPVNRYRWVRGLNEYDNWQASGVSGQGARSFYYPANSMQCADCHMPQFRSNDQGNVGGYVHSHRFAGANTAVPTANQDMVQLEESKKFLQDNQVSVDIFAISPSGKESSAAKTPQTPKPELSTSFAVGEEADISLPQGPAGEVRALTAPLGRVAASVRRGDDVRLDVVVRTRKVGHFFPGGTIDAFDVWLELQATDENGHTIFWSGKVEDGGKGPVEKGAHFYRALLIDDHGNPINKRNAWATRASVYVHLIPPGAADTAHYHLHIPDNAGQKITLHAKLNYRKFAWWTTQFSFAGVPEPGKAQAEVTPDHDDTKYAFTGDTSNVSGSLKTIPDLPIITVAEDFKTLRVLPRSAPPEPARVQLAKDDWTRWNDYGIGLFLQGDLKGAEAAFQKITEIDPRNPDGWVNVGRARVQEGDIQGAREVLEKALAIKPELARTNFFYARVLREEGQYDDAVVRLRMVLAQFPKDRVVHNELGRVFFLQKKYADATKEFEQTLAIDPEDLQAHYNLMLCYTGLGDSARAEEHKVRYLRFKADEAAQAITGAYLQKHPEDNNERQAIHEHQSVALGTAAPGKKMTPRRSTAALPTIPHAASRGSQ